MVRMRNVTITLNDEVARWARVWAAEHDTSVSKVVGEMLHERMVEERAYETSMRAFLGRKPKMLKEAGATYPSRGDLHERHVLR
jgi:hypothetical protein